MIEKDINEFRMNRRKFVKNMALAAGALTLGIGGLRPASAGNCEVPTNVILVASGQTAWEPLGALIGDADVPLNATGQNQVQSLATDLAGKRIDSMYSTSFARAQDTAAPIAATHGINVHKYRNLQDIGWGLYTGYVWNNVPDMVWGTFNMDADYPFPGGVPSDTQVVDPTYTSGTNFDGESLNMVLDRAWTSIKRLGSKHCGENVVVVTHMEIIQIALTQVYGNPVTYYSNYTVPNTSVWPLQFAPDGTVSISSNW